MPVAVCVSLSVCACVCVVLQLMWQCRQAASGSDWLHMCRRGRHAVWNSELQVISLSLHLITDTNTTLHLSLITYTVHDLSTSNITAHRHSLMFSCRYSGAKKAELNIWYRNLCLQLQRSYVSCSSWPGLHKLQQGFWPPPPYSPSPDPSGFGTVAGQYGLYLLYI